MHRFEKPKVSKKDKTITTEETFTQVVPVVFCSDVAALENIMNLAGSVKAQTYNKFGSLTGWGVSRNSSPDKIIRELHGLTGFDGALKLHEWQCLDTINAIGAQQEAAKAAIRRAIWRKYPLTQVERDRNAYLNSLKKDGRNTKAQKDKALQLFPIREAEDVRSHIFDLLNNNPTGNSWLHRVFRKEYQRGHTFQRNQIVYQSVGYKAKRLTRNTIEVVLNGLDRKSKITIALKCRHVVSGMIRVVKDEQGNINVHCVRNRTIAQTAAKPVKELGVDKGYTEAFFTSEGEEVGKGLGKLMTAKTNRIIRTNRNRYRIRAHAATVNTEKQAKILENNLGYKVKSRRLQREKATIKSFIRGDLRRMVTEATVIYAEDLTQPIRGKHQAKAINRKLNQWMKGELQDSLEVIAKETGSIVKTVNPAYTSQLDHSTGTLLGQRSGDRFISFSGDVFQADENAAKSILDRGHDDEITRYMRFEEVRSILLGRTVRYLASIGRSVAEVLDSGMLNSKFKSEALRLEAGLSPHGV